MHRHICDSGLSIRLLGWLHHELCRLFCWGEGHKWRIMLIEKSYLHCPGESMIKNNMHRIMSTIALMVEHGTSHDSSMRLTRRASRRCRPTRCFQWGHPHVGPHLRHHSTRRDLGFWLLSWGLGPLPCSSFSYVFLQHPSS